MLVIPRNQFQEDELLPLCERLQQAGWPVVVLSRTGQEAAGMNRTRFTPDGMLIDWNRQEGLQGKYPAILVLGGKGAPKSLWADDILPQIMTDHFRAGCVLGAIGLGVAVLARTALLTGEASAPDDPLMLQELEQAGVSRAPSPVTRTGNVITAEGAFAMEAFAAAVLDAVAEATRD